MTQVAIWKYDIPHRETEIEMPYDARVLHVDEQYKNLRLWAIVDPNEKRMETRVFEVIHTGDMFDSPGVKCGEMFEVPSVKRHIGTVVMHNGSYVVHVFEVE